MTSTRPAASWQGRCSTRAAARNGWRTGCRRSQIAGSDTGAETMKRIHALLVLLPLAVMLSGCVSTSAGRNAGTDAARFNARLAAEYLKRGDVKTAMQKIDKALEQDDRFAEAHLVKGMIYARAEEFGEADDHYLRAARLGDDDPAILNNVAAYLCRRGRNRDGEE